MQVAQGDVANLDADEPQRGESDGGGHVSHLPVLAFDEGELDPTGGDVGAIADGWHALPEVLWRFDDLRLAGLGAVAFDGHSFD